MRCLSRAATAGYGSAAPKGKIFNDQWNGKKLSDFYGYVHTDMPLGLGASLPSQEYADIVAFLSHRADCRRARTSSLLIHP